SLLLWLSLGDLTRLWLRLLLAAKADSADQVLDFVLASCDDREGNNIASLDGGQRSLIHGQLATRCTKVLSHKPFRADRKRIRLIYGFEPALFGHFTDRGKIIRGGFQSRVVCETLRCDQDGGIDRIPRRIRGPLEDGQQDFRMGNAARTLPLNGFFPVSLHIAGAIHPAEWNGIAETKSRAAQDLPRNWPATGRWTHGAGLSLSYGRPCQENTHA